MKDETKIVTAGRQPEDNYGIVNPPVYHASTILFPTLAEWDAAQSARLRGERGVYYGRSGTPTTFALEDVMAALDGSHRGLIYPSGIAAIASAMMAYVASGDHVLIPDNVYGPCRRFCDGVLSRFNVTTTYYDPIMGAGIADVMQERTRVVYVESPGSLTFEMQDVPAIAEAAHARGATVIMDNTWATPLYFKPFDHGVDVCIVAATKYLVGHSDAMLGFVSANQKAWPELESTTRNLGQCAGPDDVYLAQRGLRTLAVRLRRHWENGIALAEWLLGRPEVELVMHPALPGDPGHALWQRDFLGASGLFGVALKPCAPEALAAFLDGLELFGMGASWGGYESLVMLTRPNNSRTAKPWELTGPTLRFHAGLEAADDLIADLEAGFARLKRAA